MYMNILVPVAADHDKHTGKALNVARALAGEGAKITVLTVVSRSRAISPRNCPRVTPRR